MTNLLADLTFPSMRLKRAFAAATTLLALTWLGSVSASADGNPGRTPLPTPPDAVGPFCGPALGTVVAHATVNREFIKTFTQSNGTTRLEINGFLAATVTANGKTLAFNASGPTTIWIHPDNTMTVVSYGHVFAINPYGPNTGILVITGRTNVDPVNGVVTSFTGHATDVCALLT